MKYYSINKQSPVVNFREATVNGQAPDKGLYFPESIPAFGKDFINNIENYSEEEIAHSVISPYVGDEIPATVLRQIVAETVNFPMPLVKVNDRMFSLELFHGNTLAFKDVGARFMSRCLGYFVKNNDKKITVLVATSGDTGGAVADGFYDVDGVEVVILYPSGKVSNVQEKQLTTLGKNIHALEVNGSFDDCQKMVKQAFADKELTEKRLLTSANSINVARWLPQQFFYFFAYKQWQNKKQPPVISVPSGNFGNICAGLLAYQSGLPVQHFIAACNANDVVPKYMQSGTYKSQPSVATISNAMDVGDPSNFIRILEMFGHRLNDIKKVLTAESVSDQETRLTMQQVFNNHHYLLDPHAAVAYKCLQQYLDRHPHMQGIFMETAHPVKFYDVIEPLLSIEIELPVSVKNIINKTKISTKIEADYDALRTYLAK